MSNTIRCFTNYAPWNRFYREAGQSALIATAEAITLSFMPARQIGRTIAIGDIHGCAHALDTLLEQIAPGPTDHLICLGDVVDHGRDTNLVIERLLALRHECRLDCVMGNHEEMLLGALDNARLKDSWLMLGGVATLNSYKFCGDVDVLPREHVDFLANFQNYVETDSHIFAHANYDPHLPMSQQPAHVLRWSLLDDAAPRPHRSGKTVIVGHTEQKDGEVLDRGCVKCIDTYCHGYRWLTALDVNSGQAWQASRWGVLRDRGETVEGLLKARRILQPPAAS